MRPFQTPNTTQNIKFSIKDFFSKRDQIRRKLHISSSEIHSDFHKIKQNLIFERNG